MFSVVIASVIALGGLGIIFAIGLALANAKLAVKRNPLTEEILESLPGANCGACGLAGCAAYAEALATGNVPADLCTPGGSATTGRLAELLGLEVEEKEPCFAIVHCNHSDAKRSFEYQGIRDCKAAMLLTDRIYDCRHACLCLGTCVRACPFDALVTAGDGPPVVIEEKCTGCGVCANVCPKNIITVEKQSGFVHIQCRSRDKGGVARKACRRACIGCGKCAKICPVDAIEMKDFLAHIDYEKCISCSKCVGECPTGAIGDYKQKRRRKAGAA
jgi:RnfABCDGE-type electron transport complex B subunit